MQVSKPNSDASSIEAGTVDGLWRAVLLPGVLASSVLLVIYIATLSWRLPLPRDFLGFALGRDFLNFWLYGREAWSGVAGRFYDIFAYNEFLRGFAGAEYPPQQWSYPPHLLLLMAPFGLLPYLPAYLAWVALGIAALWWSVPPEWDRRRAVPGLLLGPAGLACQISGQNAFYTAAALILVYRWLDLRPIVAGIVLGLLTVKPQLGLLFPVMLVLTGRWTVFASAAATALALAGITALLFGPQVWVDYVRLGIPLQEFVIRDPTEATMGMMPTAFMNTRLIELSATAGYAVQAAFALAALGAVVLTFQRRRDPLLSYAVLVAAGMAATPYLMSYDLVALVWLLPAIATAGQLGARERPLLLALNFLPFLAVAGQLLHLPVSALVIPAFVAMLLHRLTGAGGRLSWQEQRLATASDGPSLAP